MSEPISIAELREAAENDGISETVIYIGGPGWATVLALVEAVEAVHELRQAREDLAKWETTKVSDLPIAAELFALNREEPDYYEKMAGLTAAFWDPLRERVERAAERCDETLARFTDWPADQRDT